MVKSTPQKTTVAKRAAEKIKAAPQKLVEHTVNTALNTVEKAAEKQAVRTEKAVNKRIAKAIKKAEKQAQKAPSKATTAKRAAGKIKAQIKQILSPEKEEIFYYSQKALVLLTLIYGAVALLVYMLANTLSRCGCLEKDSVLFIVLCITMVLTILALGSSVLVMIFPPRVVTVNSKTIKIDHNAPLFWKDVKLAEEKYSSSLSRRSIIVLHLRENANYPLTFMQKLCRYNVFTPFSLPLYAIDTKDANRLRKIVQKHCKYKNNAQN